MMRMGVSSEDEAGDCSHDTTNSPGVHEILVFRGDHVHQDSFAMRELSI
jgi:hypothetical protein